MARSRAASASLSAAGVDGAAAALSELLGRLPLDPAAPLDAICAGSAGLAVSGAREFLEGALAPLTMPGRIVVVSDAELVLPAAAMEVGIAIICGTGSIAVASDGYRTVQVGGWGYLLGDEGGGYWVVRETLRLLLTRRDRGEAPRPLAAALLAAVGVDDVGALQRQFYEQPHRPRYWAQFARLVMESGDLAAIDIVERAADAVGRLAASAGLEFMNRSGQDRPADAEAGASSTPALAVLDMNLSEGLEDAALRYAATASTIVASGRVPVVLAGGMFSSAAFCESARNAIEHHLPGSAIHVLAEEPVIGAVRLAARAAGWAMRPE